MGIIMLLAFVICMFAGVPIAAALGIGPLAAVLFSGKYTTLAIVHRMISGVDSYVLLAIPFFILAGDIMNFGGVTTKIFKFAYTLVGRIPGGMGHADIVASMIISGMSGSAVADASGLGKVIFKTMREHGYDDKFSAAVQSAAATVGPIIPPSIPMVVFAAMAGVSLGKMFIGGFIPGFIMGGLLMIVIYYMAKKRGYQRLARFDIKEVWKSFKIAFLPLMAPVIIIGGIMAGVVTPTEAAVIATVYAIILAVLYKTFTWKNLKDALLNTGMSSAAIIFIIATSTAFSWVLAMEGIPDKVVGFILSVTSNPYMIVALLNIILLLMGMFMESLSILTIITPFLMPLIGALGLDPVYIGVMVVVNLSIGMSTPPVGMCLFVCAKINNVKLEDLYKEIVPFLVPLLITLILVSYFPDITMFLPNLIIK